VSGWRRIVERAALAGACCAAARAQSVEESYAAGRYDRAFVALESLEDPALRAEWRYHLLHSGGDLTGALAAALDGLAVAPDSLRLLQGASECAVTLGLGQRALGVCDRWRSAAQRIADEPARAAALESVARCESSARVQLATSSTADAALRRARIVSLAGLAIACAAMAGFARRPASR
jgi:hypothetical protein